MKRPVLGPEFLEGTSLFLVDGFGGGRTGGKRQLGAGFGGLGRETAFDNRKPVEGEREGERCNENGYGTKDVVRVQERETSFRPRRGPDLSVIPPQPRVRARQRAWRARRFRSPSGGASAEQRGRPRAGASPGR